jgi:hypothetical protein
VRPPEGMKLTRDPANDTPGFVAFDVTVEPTDTPVRGASEFNVEMCRALGLDPNTVMAIDLKLRVGCIPQVAVTFAQFDEDEVLQLIRLYQLEPDDEATWEDL